MGQSEFSYVRAVLAVCALACGFAWFDMPSSSVALAGSSGLLNQGMLDGHACFLLGMLVSVVLQLAAPLWLERHVVPLVGTCLVLGVVSLSVYCTAPSAQVAALAVGVTGFACVTYLDLVIAVVLARSSGRWEQTALLVLALVVKTLLVYAGTKFLDATGQTVLVLCLPVVGVCCTLVECRLDRRMGCTSGAVQTKLDRSQSTIMLGMLLASGLLFATMRVVSNLGFWGSGYPLLLWSPLAVLASMVVFAGACYATLVRAGSGLLFRFLPALFLLFAAYAFLHSGLGVALGCSDTFLSVASQLAELYGYAFTLCVILYAIWTLSMPALRVMSFSFVVYTVSELAFQQYVTTSDSAGLVVVLLSFFVVFAAFIGTLCYFNGRDIANEGHDGLQVEDASTGYVPAGTAVRLALAARHGLSDRETAVFLMLAQGRSRKFICDELFIADGTASTYVSRVYEKFGVHSKQELIALVLEEEARGK